MARGQATAAASLQQLARTAGVHVATVDEHLVSHSTNHHDMLIFVRVSNSESQHG